MKIRLVSDIHWEFEPFKFNTEGCDVLVVAGDLADFANLRPALDALSKLKVPVVYVPGNHDYWGASYGDHVRDTAAEYGVHFLDNHHIRIQDQRFVGSTLWYEDDGFDFPDFDRVPGGRWSKIRERYYRSLAFLTNKVTEGDIVITHHLPHYSLTYPEFRDADNRGFLAKVPEALLAKPKLWLFGHTHCVRDRMIKGTRFVCNPRGYPSERNNGFDPKLIIEV